MAEKNTLSILESIRKKIQKLDEPRKSDSKDFSDIVDEFDYAAPAKKTAANVDAAAEVVPDKKEPAKVDVADDAMEREITKSFEAGDDENVEEHIVEAAPVEAESNEDNLEFEENLPDEGTPADVETHSEEVAAEEEPVEVHEEPAVTEKEPAAPTPEPIAETETVEEFLDADEEEPLAEVETEENLELDDSDFAEDETEEFEENLEEQETAAVEEFPIEEPLAEEAPEEPLAEEASEKLQPAVKEEKPQVEKSDEDELEELLRQEAALKAKENKPVPPVNSAPMAAAAPVVAPAHVVPAPPALTPAPAAVDVAKKFDNVDEFLTHTSAQETLLSQQAASNITDSIKKLVDAKNVVSGVTSFSKSEAFADIAAQLMEPRLEKWLNEHLPALVENIVREEIKKIIPKE